MEKIRLRRAFGINEDEAIKLNIHDQDALKSYYIRTVQRDIDKESCYDLEPIESALEKCVQMGEDIMRPSTFVSECRKLPAEARRDFVEIEPDTIKFNMVFDNKLYYEFYMTFDLPKFYSHFAKLVDIPTWVFCNPETSLPEHVID